MDKQTQRQQTLRQLRMEQLTTRNIEIERELESLRSNNPNRRKYTMMVGIATIFLYFLVIILVVSLIVTGSLHHMFTFFLGWTVFFALSAVWLLIHIYKLRKLDKALEEQTKAHLEELRKNHQELASLRNS